MAMTTARRPLILGAGACALGLLAGAPARAAAAKPADRVFDVLRRGSTIGRHRITFRQSGGQILADTDIQLAVRAAFIVVFRYRQTGEDVWEDGALVRSDVATNDDGKESRVTLGRAGDRLAGRGPRGAIDLPLGSMTDLNWYDRRIMERPQVLDAQNGAVNPLVRQGPLTETIEVGGRQIQATRYEVAAGSQSGIIWYDETGSWTKGILRTKGEELDYRLVG